LRQYWLYWQENLKQNLPKSENCSRKVIVWWGFGRTS